MIRSKSPKISLVDPLELYALTNMAEGQRREGRGGVKTVILETGTIPEIRVNDGVVPGAVYLDAHELEFWPEVGLGGFNTCV
eukprot:913774-Amorphochlora_amoeboformis.AAC.1